MVRAADARGARGRTHRDVAASLGVSAGVIGKSVGKANEAELTWEQGMGDEG